MLTPAQSDSETSAAMNADLRAVQSLQNVRENLHIGLMFTFIILGIPVVAMMLIKWVPLREWVSLGIALASYGLLVVVTLLRRRISYRGRMITGFLAFWVLSGLSLYYFGLSGPGFWFFITFCVINSLLYGRILGFVSLAVSLATIIPIGYGMATGAIGINLSNVANSLSGESWAVAVTLFTMMAGTMIYSQGIIHRHLRNAYSDESRLRQQLELTNSLLREQITDLKQARRETVQQESRYRLLADRVSDAIWTATLNGRITYMSPSSVRFHGYEPDEYAQIDWEKLMTEESRTKLRDAFMKIREKTQRNPDHYMFVEADVIHKYGTIIPVEMSLSRLEDPETGKTLVVGVTRDISQRKRDEIEREKLEEQLRQAQKMEAVGQLAGGVAHDFNNLLTGITGNIELSIMELDERDPMLETLNEAKRAAERAAGLTRQLLAFSRKQIIEPRPINANSLIEDLHRMLGRLLGESVLLKLDLEENLPQIIADPGQIEQVIVNLAVNARDAMPDGGMLTVTTRLTTMPDDKSETGSGQHNRYVCISVTDSGVGMDESVLPHLFEPFFTTKPVGKGTGLGLSTVYGVVRQHDGLIDVQSELGKGSCFSIYLPASSTRVVESESRDKGELLPKGDERILIVEDDKLVRGIAVRSLKRLGYRITEAANAAEALLILERPDAPFELMVTDLVMPGISGRELAERLAQISPTTRVLYTSGYTEDSVILKEIMEDEVDFLPKPYTPQTIARRVRAALDAPK